MSTLDTLAGWDYRMVSDVLKKLHRAETKEKRRAIFIAFEAENPPDGARLRALAEAAFLEQWHAQRSTAA